MQIKGIGPVKAIELHACFALAKRFLAHSHQERSPISSAKEAYLYLRDLFYQESQECLGILLLDTKLRPLHRELVHRGTIDSVLADPRIIFSKALKHHASALIVAHNHPSNDPTPSAQDLVLTKRLQECGALLGIPLKDHLIITATTYHSMSFLHNDKGNEM